MKVGLYVASQWPGGTDIGPQIGNLCAQVRAAKANGFASVWAAQNWLVHPTQMFQTQTLLARLMAEGEGMMFAPGILLLSMLNPALVAEEAATLDWMCDGNYVLAAGMGYRREEFEATGVNPKERVGRFVECIEVMRSLWTGERITHKGKHFRLTDVGISLKPKRPGGVPVWVAGGADKAVERAARLGDAWLASFNPTVPELARWMKIHRETRIAHGLPESTDYPVCREVYVAADGANALEEVKGYLLSRNVPGQAEADLDAFVRDKFIIGDAAFVRDELARYAEVLGMNHLVARMQWPGMEQDLVMKSIDRLGRVIAS